MEEASLKIFQSQVLLPFSLENGSVHAFLGPFIGQNKKKFGNSLLPEDPSTLPFIHSTEIDLAFLETPSDLSRPLWLLQLWLNTILEKKLSLTSTFTPACELEGALLTTLTPRKRSINSFATYIDAILSFTEFDEDLAPFIRTTLMGPSWLRQNNKVGQISLNSLKMWFGFLLGM
uniref:Uncharacterized protein n=1 Tax=Cajanus cajan TaxID=3821 RepID=A0A151SFW5_CAJCA|nr:hypothetical protein KK1_024523 [Cajanus cajan]